MKLILIFCFSLFLLSCSMGARKDELSSSLLVTSFPSGAEIFINGKRVGRQTPAKILLPMIEGFPGKGSKRTNFIMELKKNGFEKIWQEGFADFSQDQFFPDSFHFFLTRSGQGCKIYAQPKGIQIFVNNILHGEVSNTQLPFVLRLEPGQYEVTMMAEGYYPWSHKINVKKNEYGQLRAKLKKKGQRLIVHAQDVFNENTKVYVNDHYAGQLGSKKLDTQNQLNSSSNLGLLSDQYDDVVWNDLPTWQRQAIMSAARIREKKLAYLFSQPIGIDWSGFHPQSHQKNDYHKVIELKPGVYDIKIVHDELVLRETIEVKKDVDFEIDLEKLALYEGPYLGIHFFTYQTLTGDAAAFVSDEAVRAMMKGNDIDDLTIKSVVPHSPADIAGMKVKDKIVKLDNQEVFSQAGFKRVMFSKRPGDNLRVHVKRGFKNFEFHIKLSSRDQPFDKLQD